MISRQQIGRLWMLCATLIVVAACGQDQGAIDSENAIIDPPAQCDPARPDCSVSQDFPDGSDLNASNSAGLRFSPETNSLVVDRVSSLPDIDGDGVPDDADDCPGTPDWITCDDDPTNDGLYQTVFYDPSGAAEVVRTSIATTTADIPQIDVYFLVDATPTLEDEILALQDPGAIVALINDDIRVRFPDVQFEFGLGLYREYPLAPLAPPHTQAPYHHILDLTADELLVETAVRTLNTVANATPQSAATQALYSVASGLGLGDNVPSRSRVSCPNALDADVGYPCFRADTLHVVMNITDAAVFNGPTPGPLYDDWGFAPGAIAGIDTLPPVEMFPGLFEADSALMPLDLGDLSGRSLTLMGMSTGLTDVVNTAAAPGCVSPLPPLDMDGKDAVLALHFDSPVAGVTVKANNTHWPGAYVALFDNASLDPEMALACDAGPGGTNHWGAINNWVPMTSPTLPQYYLVADGIIPAMDAGHTPEGAFSISIVNDDDSPNPAWFTSDAPVAWSDIETALLANDIRVASVVTLNDVTMTSDGYADARDMADATDAVTKFGIPWVTEVASLLDDELLFAISNTIAFAMTSAYDISLVDVDDPATSIDERDFVAVIRHQDCAQGQPLQCDSGLGNTCTRCDIGAFLEYEVVFTNTSVSPTGASQVFDFELVAWADDAVEVERIPVRVMVPNSAAHQFDAVPGASFYRNVYDSTARCITPPEHPKWGDLTWMGSTPPGTSIEFQIRTANAVADLQTAIPTVVVIPTDTTSNTFNLTEELVADGQPWGLPYIQITAMLNPSNSPPETPTLEGWSFEFVCEAAE